MTHPPMSDEKRQRQGHHTIWCTNHDSEFTEHTEDEPYCSHMITGIETKPDGEIERRTIWVQPTHSFPMGKLTNAEVAAREALYDGIELAVETWRGPDKGWDADEQKIRLTSDVARTLAAALIRAADIEQGLTR